MKKTIILVMVSTIVMISPVLTIAGGFQDFEGTWKGRWFKTTCPNKDGLDATLTIQNGKCLYTWGNSPEWKIAEGQQEPECSVSKEGILSFSRRIDGATFKFERIKEGCSSNDGKGKIEPVKGECLRGRNPDLSGNLYIYMFSEGEKK